MNTFSACFSITGGIISPSHTPDRISARLTSNPCVLPGFVFVWVLCFSLFCMPLGVRGDRKEEKK